MSAVAHRHGVTPKLLYSWRQKIITEQEAATGKEVCLLPVEVKAPAEEAPVNMPVNTNDSTSASLEIVLPCGSRLRCDNNINPALLSQALSVLRPGIQAAVL